ncbi:MAG: SpoIIE family protein phosphatase [Planctomycetota bacterium]|nr:SpoIIE family protein phosphatase [Planctomycetota bacterium]
MRNGPLDQAGTPATQALREIEKRGDPPEPAVSLSLEDSHWDILTGNTAKDQRNVRILLESVEELYGKHELDELLSGAVDRAIRVTGAERGMLFLDGHGGTLERAVARHRTGVDLPSDSGHSDTVLHRVWGTGEPSLLLDAAGEVDLSHSMHKLQLLSVMGVPLPAKGRNLGVLYVDSTGPVQDRFTRSDLAVFQALGGLIALAVENGRLRAARAEKERMQRDLGIARDIQRGLLPEELPQVDGFDIAGIWMPCEETSGDYYDVLPVCGDRLALIVGDVSDHGLAPAMLMASTCALMHTALLANAGPIEVIKNVNAFLERDAPAEKFMTMFLGMLDPQRRELRYVSAGHEPPLLLSRDGTLEELPKTGRALGILAQSNHVLSDAHTLESGQVLFLYTDGIYEAHGPDGEIYGEERFQASFRKHAQGDTSARAILDGVLEDLQSYVEDRPLEDDVTCLVVRVL